jgi:hypothetical protein
MIGFLTLVFCAAAGLIGAPWSITLAAALVLAMPTLIRQIQHRGGYTASIPVIVLPNLALNALFSMSAFMLGHGIALLWLA